MSEWNFLDIVFTGIVIISTVFALLKGLVREIISLVALLGGFILAMLYYQVPAALLADFCRNDSVANLLGFIIIFCSCILIGIIAAFLVNRFIKAASLKWIDRVLGGIFGFLRGWAISSIIVIALIAFPIRERIMDQSILAPFLLAGARAAVLLVPQELKNKFNEQYQRVLHSWNQSRSAK
jgi:membrane protein required for colicin V production